MKATHGKQVSSTFCYCYTAETNGWYYIETSVKPQFTVGHGLKPDSLLWAWLVVTTKLGVWIQWNGMVEWTGLEERIGMAERTGMVGGNGMVIR